MTTNYTKPQGDAEYREFLKQFPTTCVSPDDLYAVLIRVPQELRDDAYWRVASALPGEDEGSAR